MGPWGIAGILLVGASLTEGGRQLLRKTVREVVKVGFKVADKSSAVIAELKEESADLIAEAKEDRKENGRRASKQESGKATRKKSDEE